MVTAPKSSDKSDNYDSYFFYDKRVVENKFRLPERDKELTYSPLSFFYDSVILSTFCFRNKRFKSISNVIFKLIKEIKNGRKNKKFNHGVIAKHLLTAFIELDSTFIKIGQFLSTRKDILPIEYIMELSKLQDSVSSLSYKEIKTTIEKEFHKPIDDMFSYFCEIPIASASIGQVHKAELKNGTEVVVKIQRPNLEKLFYDDLAILRCIATYLERHTDLGKGREWTQIVDEIGKTLFEEIDFIQEGKNADHFRQNLKSNERIYIPRIFWQYSTRKILMIEYVPGIKITDLETLKSNSIDPRFLCLTLVNAYFKQFFEDGFFHADPHPGNIVVKNDGTIVFYDFGMVGRINESIRSELANVLISVIGNDTDTLLKTLKNLELIKNGTDIKPIKKLIEQIAYSYYDGAELNDLNIKGLEEDIKKVFDEKPMRLPSKFTYTLRATGTLEGICRTLDPNFSLISCAKPYFYNWIKNNSPDSKWSYLKSLFPKQKKVIDKVQVYLEVVKDLPKYVSMKEDPVKKDIPKKTNDVLILKDEVKETKSKLNFAYEIIFLLSVGYAGSFLIERTNTILSGMGLVLLGFTLIISIGILSFSLFKGKMLK